MKKIKPKIKIYVILLIGFGVGTSYSQRQDLNRINLIKVDSFFNNQIDSGKLAGSIILVSIDHKIQHLKSYGYLDIKESIPMNKNIRIPIASMTKIITSIAILQLYEDKLLSLDDPVEKYIPEFKNLKVSVKPDTILTEDLKSKPTIRDLLRHTSGMVYSSGKSVSDKLYLKAGFREWNSSLEDFVKKITTIPLAFQPNENWNYSYSHDILGYLIEIISGTPLNEFCMQRIFKPMGLKNTDFYVPKEKSDQLSNLYNYKNGELEIDDLRDSSIYNTLPKAISGGGGWWSSYGGVVTTIEEFHIISKMLLNYGKHNDINIISKKTVELMISNQIGDLNAFGNKYGLGVGVRDSGKEIFWAGAPYNTSFWINFDKNLIGILFTNTAPFGHLNMMSKFKELTLQSIENVE